VKERCKKSETRFVSCAALAPMITRPDRSSLASVKRTDIQPLPSPSTRRLAIAAATSARVKSPASEARSTEAAPCQTVASMAATHQQQTGKRNS